MSTQDRQKDKATNGKTSLLRDFVEQRRTWLTRVIASRTGANTLVEDVLQEVSLAAARSESPPKQGEEDPWLCAIAIRQCALAMRKAQRRKRLLDGAASQASESAPRRDDPIYWLMDRERSDLLREALGEMEPEERLLLTWKYVEGRTYGQLATHLRVAPHVAEYRVVTARKRLRTLLIERGLGKEDLT